MVGEEAIKIDAKKIDGLIKFYEGKLQEYTDLYDKAQQEPGGQGDVYRALAVQQSEAIVSLQKLREVAEFLGPEEAGKLFKEYVDFKKRQKLIRPGR